MARNKVGQTVAKARLVVGDIPSAPDSPEATDVSDTEMLLRWRVPRQDGNSSVLCYSLQQKLASATANDWTDLAENIDHEFFVVRNLSPNTEYQFRLAARNKFGWSDRSIPTPPISTKDVGSPRVSVTRAMKYLQQLTESGQQLFLDDQQKGDGAAAADYGVETNPKQVKPTPPTDDLSFIAEINRGRTSLIAKCADKDNNRMFAAKIVKKDEISLDELKVLRTLCHERIVSLHQVTSFTLLHTALCIWLFNKQN